MTLYSLSTHIIPKNQKSARIFCIFLLFLLCRLVYGSQENAKYESDDKGTAFLILTVGFCHFLPVFARIK